MVEIIKSNILMFVCFDFIIGDGAKARRNSPPHPPPPAAPERISGTCRNCVSNFAQNGFALFSEYPTIQNFSTFSLGTSRNARRAQRHGSQEIEPHNPTAH